MDKKISQLAESAEITSSAVFPIVQDGTNKKISAANLFGKINVPVRINAAGEDQDTIISGESDDNLVFVDASANKVGIGRATPLEKLDVAGGLRLNGVTRNESVVTQTSSGPIDLTSATTVMAIGSAATATIANGASGQVKEIVCDGAGPVVITGPSTAFTSITMDTVGETVTLKFIAGKWYIMSSAIPMPE